MGKQSEVELNLQLKGMSKPVLLCFMFYNKSFKTVWIPGPNKERKVVLDVSWMVCGVQHSLVTVGVTRSSW